MRSNACEMGLHETCGGATDCTCDCHEPYCPSCGNYSADCECWYDDESALDEPVYREASPEDALTHDDQLTADREYRATRPMPFNG